MKYMKKNILIVSIVFLGLCFSSSCVVAEPVVSDVEIDPAIPEPLSTVTITATITSDEDIETVNIVIKECIGTPEESGLCYTPETFEMTLAGDDTYTVDYDLHYSDAGYFGYHFEINGVEYGDGDTNVLLKASPSNGGDNGGDDDNGSPGFELVIVVIAIFIGVVLLNRKRSR